MGSITPSPCCSTAYRPIVRCESAISADFFDEEHARNSGKVIGRSRPPYMMLSICALGCQGGTAILHDMAIASSVGGIGIWISMGVIAAPLMLILCGGVNLS